ncbi:MAG: hypothetical protein JWN70_2525 [Planctomycetaceae bacterium]|nr:hypothetical protein [Planctomycetaceae bacterium]
MIRTSALCLGLTLLAAATFAADAPVTIAPFVFRDVGAERGLFPAAQGILGHAAGWGDVDGDGLIDLYIGTFHKGDSPDNLFFRNAGPNFRLDDQPQLRIPSRATGALFADLDNDGDLDLYVSSMPQPKNQIPGCSLFQNDGTGKFTNISDKNGACPQDFGGRSATVLDFDGDGLLDLLVGEDPLPGYNGSKTKSTRLFRNLGDMQFEDASRAAGLPVDVPGLGVAAGDVNNDGWPDFFVAAHHGGNRLLINDGTGKFREATGSRETFHWPDSGGDNMVCGVCFGDVNRDGWLDIVLGQHFDSPWVKPVASRIYLHRGLRNGSPVYTDVTETVGLVKLPLKAPHVEVQDFDNDGWPDISVSMVKFVDGQPHPIIFRNQGLTDGLPRFKADALAVNDFPLEVDQQLTQTGKFFKKMLADEKVIYTAPGPTGDFDNDGRLDMFLPSWWPERRSLLLHNETRGGNWLQVQLQGPVGVNAMGIGARLNVYPAGQFGNRAALLGCREMATGYGYASAQPAISHFGLGGIERVDLEIIWPHGKGRMERRDVTVNQRLNLKPTGTSP